MTSSNGHINHVDMKFAFTDCAIHTEYPPLPSNCARNYQYGVPWLRIPTKNITPHYMKNTVKIKLKNPDEEIDPIQGPLNRPVHPRRVQNSKSQYKGRKSFWC